MRRRRELSIFLGYMSTDVTIKNAGAVIVTQLAKWSPYYIRDRSSYFAIICVLGHL